MARYTGPVFKKSRRYQFSVLETNKEFVKGKGRTTVPGFHGNKRQKKLSNYGQHLYEKQKVRFMYGLGEKQFRTVFNRAGKMPGVHGENFLALLESRLDNVVFRLGVAPTRRASRQIVNHGHVFINGKKVDIPSYHIEPGMKITFKKNLQDNAMVKDSLNSPIHVRPFVEFNKDNFEGQMLRLPERTELNQEINEAYIVEYYNK